MDQNIILKKRTSSSFISAIILLNSLTSIFCYVYPSHASSMKDMFCKVSESIGSASQTIGVDHSIFFPSESVGGAYISAFIKDYVSKTNDGAKSGKEDRIYKTL